MSSVTACAVSGLNDEHASYCLVHEQCQVLWELCDISLCFTGVVAAHFHCLLQCDWWFVRVFVASASVGLFIIFMWACWLVYITRLISYFIFSLKCKMNRSPTAVLLVFITLCLSISSAPFA